MLYERRAVSNRYSDPVSDIAVFQPVPVDEGSLRYSPLEVLAGQVCLGSGRDSAPGALEQAQAIILRYLGSVPLAPAAELQEFVTGCGVSLTTFTRARADLTTRDLITRSQVKDDAGRTTEHVWRLNDTIEIPDTIGPL